MINRSSYYLKIIIFLFFALSCTPVAAYQFCPAKLWGQPATNLLYLGMWTYHPYDYKKKFELFRNDLVLFVYRGFLACTFINCYGDRTYAVGIQRYWLQTCHQTGFESKFGYRAGLFYGYDERLHPIAGKLIILPCAQIIYDLSWKNVGIELSYTGVIVSAGFFINFK